MPTPSTGTVVPARRVSPGRDSEGNGGTVSIAGAMRALYAVSLTLAVNLPYNLNNSHLNVLFHMLLKDAHHLLPDFKEV